MNYEVFGEIWPNPNIVSVANSYFESAELLNNADGRQFSIPSITCYAFAIELYLKSLHAEIRCLTKDIVELEDGVKSYGNLYHQSHLTGHKLHRLLDRLPDEVKFKVNKSYQRYFDDRADTELLSELKDVTDAFVKWRYAFEGNPGALPMSKLISLARFFKEYTYEQGKTC